MSLVSVDCVLGFVLTVTRHCPFVTEDEVSVGLNFLFPPQGPLAFPVQVPRLLRLCTRYHPPSGVVGLLVEEVFNPLVVLLGLPCPGSSQTLSVLFLKFHRSGTI